QQSYVKPLDEVKEHITATLRNNKIQTLLAFSAQELLTSVAAGQALAAVAADAGYELNTVENGELSDASIDREVVRQAFSLANPLGESPVLASTRTMTGDYAVFAL